MEGLASRQIHVTVRPGRDAVGVSRDPVSYPNVVDLGQCFAISGDRRRILQRIRCVISTLTFPFASMRPPPKYGQPVLRPLHPEPLPGISGVLGEPQDNRGMKTQDYGSH